jgi:hypothetical protein
MTITATTTHESLTIKARLNLKSKRVCLSVNNKAMRSGFWAAYAIQNRHAALVEGNEEATTRVYETLGAMLAAQVPYTGCLRCGTVEESQSNYCHWCTVAA